MTGLQVGVGLLARLEHRETGHPLDDERDLMRGNKSPLISAK